MIELELRRRCLELPEFGALVFSATVASRISPVAQVYLMGTQASEDFYRIDAGIRSMWKSIYDMSVSRSQVIKALARSEHIAETLDSLEDPAAVRCEACLDVISAALGCSLAPSSKLAATVSAAAIDMVYQWLEFEIEENEADVVSLEQTIRLDRRFDYEISCQEDVLPLAMELTNSPLEKRMARSMQGESEEQSMHYMDWMKDLMHIK